MSENIGHWIAGKRIAGTSGRYGDVCNPAVGEKSGQVVIEQIGDKI